MSRDERDTDICYEVRNKVFRMLFWTEEAANGFLSATSPTEGYRIEKLHIFGSRYKEVYDEPRE